MALGAIWVDGVWDEAIWDNAIWLQNQLPTVTEATIDFAGSTITLTTSKAVAIGAGGNGGFALTMSGGAVTMTYSSGDGTDALVYSLSRSISPDETGTLAYTQPGDGIEGAIIGDDMATFSGFTVTVGSLLQHNRQMRHTRITLDHMDPSFRHNDPTLDHNE